MEYRKNEKGVALLLALGFAALLLVLIMGFVTNALIERKVAANVGDKMEVKAIAKSAINRALAAINYQIAMQTTQGIKPYDKGVYRFDNIVSKDPDADETDQISVDDLKEYFYELDTNRYVFKYRDGIYLYEYPYADRKDYSYNNDAADGKVKYRRPQWQYVKNADGFLTGRFLYAVLPDMGKVYYEAGKQASDRAGQSLKDFHVNSIDGMSDSYYEDTPLVMRAKKLIDNDKKITKDNLIVAGSGAWRLFYLYGIESDSDIAWSESSGEDNNKRNYKYLSENDTFDSDMVYVFDMKRDVDELFSEVKYLDDIDPSSEKTQREKQIAANLIEAFNPNIAEDVVHDGNFDDTTTYTGNRRTPYINEIEIKMSDFKADVKVEDTKNDNGDIIERKYVITPEVKVQVSVELYDPYRTYVTGNEYDIETNSDSKIKVRFYIREGESGTPVAFGEEQEFDFKKDDNVETAFSADTINYYHKRTFTPKDDKLIKIVDEEKKLGPDDFTRDFYISARITSVPMQWKLKNSNGDVVDFVKNISLPTDSVPSESYIGAIKLPQNNANDVQQDPVTDKIYSFQAKDARDNLDGKKWNLVTDPEDGSNIGKKNAEGIEIPPYFPDVAAAKDKVSLADLVYISRGEAGNTLNILGGDKKLLDQLTTLKKSDLPQLIDINTRSIYLWGGLLSNIKYKKDDGEEGDAIAAEDVVKLAKAISVRLRNRTEVLKRRSDFVEELNGAVTAEGMTMTDEQQNAVIGKIMPLCKIEDYPEYFYMIIIAQGVKDNQSDDDNKGIFDSNDTVTAEVRYLVKLHRDNNNKIRILSQEELID